MKKKFYLLGMAAIMMAGCTSDEFAGDMPAIESNNSGAIAFSGISPNITRAGDILGSDAATRLDNQFFVYGVKNMPSSAPQQTVFQNYSVEYGANSAGGSDDNTHGWAYVGKTSMGNIGQEIKYWDDAADNYYFYAFSSKDVSTPANSTTDAITVVKTTGNSDDYQNGYVVTFKNANADISSLYFADRKVQGPSVEGAPVVFTFRASGARVRVGFYETIPGYSVKINKFYTTDAATPNVTGMTSENTQFAANVVNRAIQTDSKLTVTYSKKDGTGEGYDNDGLGDNVAKYEYEGLTTRNTLSLGANVVNAAELSAVSSSPTWDIEGGEYTAVLPNTPSGNMIVKLDFTLTSSDRSGEKIEVKGANVAIPKQYLTWNNNYAYTYIFKISDNTNGVTGNETTPGLYPITFDAVVANPADAEIEEGSVTTVYSPAITTYQAGSVSAAGISYVNGTDPVYVTISEEGTPVDITTADTKLFVVAAGTEEVDLISVAPTNEVTGGIVKLDVSTTVGSVTFTTNDAKLASIESAKTYAIQYKVNDAEYKACETGSKAIDGVTYYTDENGSGGTNLAAGTDLTGKYYKVDPVYAYKVIQVQ